MLSVHSIRFIFNALNTGAFFGLIYFVFIKKVKPGIKTKIQEEEIFWQNLHINKQALLDQQHKLDLEIDMQKLYGTGLLKKIEQWHHTVDEQQEQFNAQAQECAQKMYHHSLKIQEHRMQEEMMRVVIPQACAKTRKAMHTKFEDSKAVEHYFDKIFSCINKSS
ncbi:MAG: hypothetical protein AB7R69_04900 [Candidatus Babeliales bacterium]